MQRPKSSDKVNRKRRRRGGTVKKKLRLLESKVRVIYRAGQDATIMTTTGTGEFAERRTAAGNCHSKMTGNVVGTINDDVVLMMTMILTDNGNGGGTQVSTMTSGVVTIAK